MIREAQDEDSRRAQLVALVDQAGDLLRAKGEAERHYNDARSEIASLLGLLDLTEIEGERFAASMKEKIEHYIDPVAFIAETTQKVQRQCLAVVMVKAREALGPERYSALERSREGRPSLRVTERKL